MAYLWEQLELIDIGFSAKGVNKIHYFSSNDIYYPSPLCDRDIPAEDFASNYLTVKITNKNKNNICEICEAEYLRLFNRKLRIESASNISSFNPLKMAAS